MPDMTLTALIVARDEAEHLPGCLASVSWADERIVVVDAASRDRTEAIAREVGARVLVRPFDHFAAQRNAGLERARCDWILSIDADERVTPGLRAAIRERLATVEHEPVGYRIPIRSEILGRPFRYSGTQHDRPLRLFRRGAGDWVGEVHETVALVGPVGQLDEPLTHQTLPDMQTFLRKLDRYTSLEATRLHREGRQPRPFDLTLRPLWTFAKLYGLKQGFRDGREGFAFCALSAVSVAVRQWKLRELTRASGRSAPARRLRTATAAIGGHR